MSDTMLLGVLRMPFDLAMSTLTSRIQYHRRGVQAADEIEQRTRERNEARAEVERLREALREWDGLIRHQYSGTREAMSDMQYAALNTKRILDELESKP